MSITILMRSLKDRSKGGLGKAARNPSLKNIKGIFSIITMDEKMRKRLSIQITQNTLLG